MIRTLSIECPHCSKTFDVFLSGNASMIILNCPLCLTPLIYYKNRCFVLSKHQIDRIKKSRQSTTVLKILHSIAREEPQSLHRRRTLPHFEDDGIPVAKYIAPRSEFRTFGGDNHISRDDIINLRIELETCADCGQFIERM